MLFSGYRSRWLKNKGFFMALKELKLMKFYCTLEHLSYTLVFSKASESLYSLNSTASTWKSCKNS